VQVAAREADGTTWLFAPAPVLVIFPYTTDLVPYSPEDDFSRAMVARFLRRRPNPHLNVKSLHDLITLATRRPAGSRTRVRA